MKELTFKVVNSFWEQVDWEKEGLLEDFLEICLILDLLKIFSKKWIFQENIIGRKGKCQNGQIKGR